MTNKLFIKNSIWIIIWIVCSFASGCSSSRAQTAVGGDNVGAGLRISKYKLKNWGTISPSHAADMGVQIQRQEKVITAYKGNHGGLIVGSHTKISNKAQEVLKFDGIKVWQVADGKLAAYISK